MSTGDTMEKQKFVPLTGLDNLSETEKHDYYVNCCAHYGIPAELNLLQFMWLDSNDGTGEKHLVLYAKRGATDLMRGVHGISVDEIKETLGDGFVMFTAKGHDKTGRTDVAVGSANLKGLSGKHLDNALMTAQTRASRRLTLQFVGGGLLDESEVQALVGGAVSASAPVGVVSALPTVAPSTAIGKDATSVDPKELFSKEIIDVAKTVQDDFNKVFPSAEPVEEPKKRRGRRRKSEVDLGSGTADSERYQGPPGDLLKMNERRELPRTEPLKSIEDITYETIRANEPTAAQQAARDALIKIPSAAVEEDDEVKKLEEALAKARAKKITEVKMALTASEPTLSIPQPEPEKSVLKKGMPTEEQAKEYKTRLSNYVDVLNKGGMKPSEIIGGAPYKLRAFVRMFFPQTPEQKNLTVDQWNAFFGYLDGKHEELGAEGLVKLVNEKLGVKE